jgi:ATP-dependent Lon protease
LLKKEYLLLPLRDVVIFPECMTVLTISGKNNVVNIEKAFLNNEKIFCILQREKMATEIKSENDLFKVGTLCDICQKISLSGGDLKVFLKGERKLKLDKLLVREGGLLSCLTKTIKDEPRTRNDEKTDQIKTIVFEKIEFYMRSKMHINFELMSLLKKLDKDMDLIYILTNVLNMDATSKQLILESCDPAEQLIKINQFLETEKNLRDTEQEINSKVDKQFQKYQRDFFLKEKLKAIKKELKNIEYRF